jgi:hypothetical protein
MEKRGIERRGEEGRWEMGGWEVGREVGERDWVETHDRRGRFSFE